VPIFDPREVGRQAGSSRTGGQGSETERLRSYLAQQSARDAEDEREDRVPGLPRRATLAQYNEPTLRYGAGRPRYFDGDEFLPGNISPNSIAALQREMVRAGLLDSPRWGHWDEESQSAYRQLLREANTKGLDYETLLRQYSEAATLGTEEQAVFTPPEALPLELPSDEDLRHVVRGVSIEKLGIAWRPEDTEQFVQQYKAMAQGRAQAAYEAEVERQRAAFDRGEPVSNVAIEMDIPTAEVWADEEARRRDPGGYQATQINEDYMPAFLAALGGFAG
jgi:hypothetical protein